MLVNEVNNISLSPISPLNHFFEQFSRLHHNSMHYLLLAQLIVKSSYVHFELTHFKLFKEIRIARCVHNGY
jgi:hypothetical protein